MWNNTSDLNESLIGGNGFMTGVPNMPNAKSRINTQNLLPCTIATILLLDPSRDSIIIGDVEIHQIVLVGLIKSVKLSPTNISYELDDMTGPPIDVKLWFETKTIASHEIYQLFSNTNHLKCINLYIISIYEDSDNMTENINQEIFPENIYIKVFGSIRSFSGKKSVLAFKIVPIVDMNELTTHLLEIVHSQMKLAKISQPNGHANQSSMMGTNKISLNSTGKQMEDSMANASFTQGYNLGLNMVAQQVIYRSIRPWSNPYNILRVISSCNSEEGFTISHVKNSLSSVSLEQVRNEMEFLCNEGHIYCTIDDDHYKATDNFF